MTGSPRHALYLKAAMLTLATSLKRHPAVTLSSQLAS